MIKHKIAEPSSSLISCNGKLVISSALLSLFRLNCGVLLVLPLAFLGLCCYHLRNSTLKKNTYFVSKEIIICSEKLFGSSPFTSSEASKHVSPSIVLREVINMEYYRRLRFECDHRNDFIWLFFRERQLSRKNIFYSCLMNVIS